MYLNGVNVFIVWFVYRWYIYPWRGRILVITIL